jgi:hypothetical protein
MSEVVLTAGLDVTRKSWVDAETGNILFSVGQKITFEARDEAGRVICRIQTDGPEVTGHELAEPHTLQDLRTYVAVYSAVLDVVKSNRPL